jgi:hypothetical protein
VRAGGPRRLWKTDARVSSILDQSLPLRRGRPIDVATRFLTSIPVLALLVALVTWQPIETTPAAGLDPSWHVALNLAAHRGLDWGSQFVFTYGPLGYLAAPLTMYGVLAVLGAVYAVAVRVGFAAAVLWVARRRAFPLPIAIVLALVLSALATRLADPILPLVFLLSAAALADDPPPIPRAAVIYGGGFVGALESLVKLNTGLAIVLMVFATVLGLAGGVRGNALRWAAAFAASAAALWFAAGQGIANVGDYIATAFSLIAGYSSAMQVLPSSPWVPLAALLVAASALVAAWLVARPLPLRRRGAFLAVVVIFLFAVWKEGVVRNHTEILFAWLLVPWLAFADLRPARRAETLIALAAVTLLFFGATGASLGQEAHPLASADDAVNEVYDLTDPGKRKALNDRARYYAAVAYGLDRRTRALIGGRPVDVYPWETSLAWTYGLNWDPEPVFQAYAAYTPALDDRNADALASSNGPELILRHGFYSAHLPAVDGRYGPYDTPAATLAMICNFRALRTTSRYQLLVRTPNRCGSPRELRSVSAGYGDPVRVPRAGPGEVVFAKVDGLDPSGTEAIQSFLFRPAIRHVTFDGARTYRFVPANAADGLILRAPSRIDFPRPWQVAPNPRTIAFTRDAAVAIPSGSLGVRFYAMRVRPLRSESSADGAQSPR